MITTQDIDKLAHLARIKLDETEKQDLVSEIDSILSYVDQVKNAGVNESIRSDSHRNVMRDDSNPHQSGLYSEAILNSAPQRNGDTIEVKKIFE